MAQEVRVWPLFDERTQLYDFVGKEIISTKPIQYLEFGVYQGHSIKYFAGLNMDAASKICWI